MTLRKELKQDPRTLGKLKVYKRLLEDFINLIPHRSTDVDIEKLKLSHKELYNFYTVENKRGFGSASFHGSDFGNFLYYDAGVLNSVFLLDALSNAKKLMPFLNYQGNDKENLENKSFLYSSINCLWSNLQAIKNECLPLVDKEIEELERLAHDARK